MALCNIVLPASLQVKVNHQENLQINGDSIKDILNILVEKFPEINKDIYDVNGDLRRFLNVFVDGDNIRDIDGLDTVPRINATITLLSAVAGG
jgi:sulfur-carrier protein